MEKRTDAVQNCHRKDHKIRQGQFSILLACVRPRGGEVNNTFVFDNDPAKMNFNSILKQSDDYCQFTFL